MISYDFGFGVYFLPTFEMMIPDSFLESKMGNDTTKKCCCSAVMGCCLLNFCVFESERRLFLVIGAFPRAFLLANDLSLAIFIASH